MCSERRTKKSIYEAINAAASPGDIVFVITTGFAYSAYQKVWRSWMGQSESDSSKWHTALYSESKKERRGATLRPYIVHSAENGSRHTGTIEEHISPSYYTDSAGRSTTLELVSMRGLDPERRELIVEYARQKLGTPHDDRGWRRDFPTYGLGLPIVRSPGKISCHELIFEAYGSVGIEFRHQTDHMPWFNPARWTGHPIGHPADRVNLKSVYLRDHHLYADERFDVVLSVRRTDDDLTIVHNPAKFSWLAAHSSRVPESAPQGIRGRVLTEDRDLSLVNRAG